MTTNTYIAALLAILAAGCGAIAYGDEDADGLDPEISQDAPESPDGSEEDSRADPGVDRPEDATWLDDSPGFDDARDADPEVDELAPPDDAVLEDVEGEEVSHPDIGTECHGPFINEGVVVTPGECLAVYHVGVYAGETYTVTGCAGPTVNDIVLAVYGACNCTIYERCGGTPGAADYCTCTAHEDGVMVICASGAQAGEFIRWSYRVEDGPCWDAM